MIDNPYERNKGEFSISTDPARLDIAAIHDFLANRSYWSQGIPRQTLERAILNSIPFGLYRGTQQVGFARVISDRTSFAYLADVFILEPFRGQGLSKWLVAAILDHPDLQNLKRFMLHTKDAHGLYAQFGFTAAGNSNRIMEKTNLDVYRKNEN